MKYLICYPKGKKTDSWEWQVGPECEELAGKKSNTIFVLETRE